MNTNTNAKIDKVTTLTLVHPEDHRSVLLQVEINDCGFAHISDTSECEVASKRLAQLLRALANAIDEVDA